MSLTGRLLVASPVMGDPNFAGSVVLVCAHDDDGAVGLVLDRPTDLPVRDHLPDWASNVAEPTVVFLGGPVNPEMAVGLGEGDAAGSGWSPVVGSTGLIDFEGADPSRIGRLRVFAGYAGWSAGQLETEVTDLDWIVVPAHPDDAFDPDPEGIRERALRRKGGLFPAYEYYPADPALN
ncbi:MAG TPA: YqgE/AlgH family protein [Acidimicrobiia bacterium]|nr:YqgE/AlgH family protein [Acidimicrobiia bacterium]